MPARRYWWRGAVEPERARLKSLVARSRASGGSWEGDFGGAGVVVGLVVEGWGVGSWGVGRPMALMFIALM